MLKGLLLAIILMAGAQTGRAEEADHATHQELRALLTKVETAINSGKYEELAPCFHEQLRITTINQEVLGSRAEIGTYFNKWFGPGGYLKKLHMSLKADALTEFYADKTMGIVRGSGEEDYTLADGRFFPMKIRWTATVIEDKDGVWRILSIHMGTNFLSNPILAKAESALGYAAGGGLLVGLILGGGFMFFVFRKKGTA